jgi:hypothetical protein
VSIPTILIGADDALELVELLSFVADLCESDTGSVDLALVHFVGTGYDAGDLRADVVRLADHLARVMGFADASMEPAS